MQWLLILITNEPDVKLPTFLLEITRKKFAYAT